MLKPSFRLFIVPLGAVATLATLSAQNVQPRAQRDSGSTFVREQVVDCGTKSPKEICVISYDSETPAEFPVSQALDLPSNLQRPGRDAPQPGRSAFGGPISCATRHEKVSHADSEREDDAIVIHPHALPLDGITPVVMSAAGDGCCGKRE